PPPFPTRRSSDLPAPHIYLVQNIWILPMTGHYFSFQTHPRHHESKLSISMSTLVQVHKVHIDRVPWNISIELGMQMQQRLLHCIQSADPHLGRRESMHPSDYSHAIIVNICFPKNSVYFFCCLYNRFKNYFYRYLRRLV